MQDSSTGHKYIPTHFSMSKGEKNKERNGGEQVRGSGCSSPKVDSEIQYTEDNLQ